MSPQQTVFSYRPVFQVSSLSPKQVTLKNKLILRRLHFLTAIENPSFQTFSNSIIPCPRFSREKGLLALFCFKMGWFILKGNVIAKKSFFYRPFKFLGYRSIFSCDYLYSNQITCQGASYVLITEHEDRILDIIIHSKYFAASDWLQSPY